MTMLLGRDIIVCDSFLIFLLDLHPFFPRIHCLHLVWKPKGRQHSEHAFLSEGSTFVGRR